MSFLAEPFYPHLTTLLTFKQLPSNWSRRLKEFAAKRDQATERILQRVEALTSRQSQHGQTPTAGEAKTLAKLERERHAWLDRLQNGSWQNGGVTWDHIQKLAIQSRPGFLSIKETFWVN